MKSIFRYSLSALLALSLIQNGPSFSQKKVEGSIIQNGKLVSQFIGDKFTLLKNDGYAIYNLSGEALVTGIKTPSSLLSSAPLDINHGAYFEKAAGGSVLKNLSGKPLSTTVYSNALPFITDNTPVLVASTVTDKKIAYIDTLGKEIISVSRDNYFKALGIDTKLNFSVTDHFIAKTMFFAAKDFKPFSDGLTTIFNPETKRYGYVNTSFTLAIPAAYTDAEIFSGGLAAVMDVNKNWGYINKAGDLKIPYSYSKKPGRFNSGLARVSTKTGKYGYINQSNEITIEPTYTYGTVFYKGYALVRDTYNSPVLLIDTKGTVVTSFDPDYSFIDSSASSTYSSDDNPFFVPETLIQLVDYGKAIFKGRGGFSLIDKSGKEILKGDYKLLKDYHDGKMLAHWSKFIDGKTQHRYGIIDEQGNFLIEFTESVF